MSEDPKIFRRFKLAIYKSPIGSLIQAARESNLLGANDSMNPSFPGNENRISYQHSKQIIKDLAVKFLQNRYSKSVYSDIVHRNVNQDYFRISDEDTQTYTQQMIDGLADLGSYKLSGAELSKFVVLTELLSHGLNVEDPAGLINITCDNQTFVGLATVAAKLSSAVGLLEGNLPPNESGIMPDHVLGAVRKDEIVCEQVNEAFETLRSLTDFQDKGLPKFYNAIIDRIQYHRPLFMEKPVNTQILPTFSEE